MKILNIVGARPNFMKIAPIIQSCQSYPDLQQIFLHTGQHYDQKMSKIFFEELGLPIPDINLEVGSASHAQQTALIMERFEPILLAQKPDWVIVLGDVNSTVACALVCAKLGIPVAHVEAGLRSFDRTMPEEINRILTDQISDLLFTTEASANTNLGREGIDPTKIHFVGNVMIDTLISLLPQAEKRTILFDLNLYTTDKDQAEDYILVTLHRPHNVDVSENIETIVDVLADLSRDINVIVPLHPRTRQRLHNMALMEKLSSCQLLEPLGYLDFLRLQQKASLVLTDSGGVQEETTYLGVPCVTIRPNTERPITITHGTNELVACDRTALLSTIQQRLNQDRQVSIPPPLWDGHSAERIVKILHESL